MSFWEKFKQSIPLRHVIFILVLFLVTLVIFQFDSAEDIKVDFGDTSIDIKASGFTMNIPYDMIASLEITNMPDGGDSVSGTDNMVKRTGTWQNEAWGEYSVCADLDCTVCIVAHLTDGQTFVFSRKNNAETQSIYEQLLTLLPTA